MFIKKPCTKCGAPVEAVDPQWLRGRRERSGLSLRAFAKRIKFSPPYLSDVERGRRGCTEKIFTEYKRLQEGS